MTTTVTIAANHGWPVDVTVIPVREQAGQPERTVRVAAGETYMTYIHSGHDLRITEVQPNEIAPTSTNEA